MPMLAADVYRPDQRHDFFVMVGGAAAVLAGLVFVALSLNLGVVISDATHRYRAIGTLTDFAGIFVVCAFALMGGQDHVAVGVEWLLVSVGAAAVYSRGTSERGRPEEAKCPGLKNRRLGATRRILTAG
jgi:hypothetical protein